MLHRLERKFLLSKKLTFQAMSTEWVYPLPVVNLPYYMTHNNTKDLYKYMLYISMQYFCSNAVN